MRDLRRFATADRPLHPSGLRELIVCPWRKALEFLESDDGDQSGAAGDTGSAMHKAAAAFHRGKEVAESIAEMQDNLHLYPKADLQDAASLFLAYAYDPRNRVEVLLVEEAITFTLAPASEDPTGEPIVIEGTVDQVRLVDGRPRVWDIKTTKKDPEVARNKATFQLAAYCIGASFKLNTPVHPGGIILPRKYSADSTGPVFRPVTWKFEDIEQIMLPVRQRVAEIRAGKLYHIPNEDCTWCRQRMPDLCFPKLQALRVRS
jgi:hypothetical protein